MARIRSVRPEFRISLTATGWPREVRLFFALLWGFLDDHGYGIDEPRLIWADCFPMDADLNPAVIDSWLSIIAADGSLCRFQGPDGRRYLHAPKWSIYQRPQHPAAPRYPECRLSHEAIMNGSHETIMSQLSGDSHETGQRKGDPAGQPNGRDSHESLSPERVKGGVVGEVGVTREPRPKATVTLLANAILDEHKRLVRPALPRDVQRRIGEQIDLLLGDPEVTPDEIRQGLAKLRANPRLAPGVLSSLVNEVRQLAAHPELGITDRRQDSTDRMFEAAAQRIAARKEISP
jgi:hypothetical protein